MIRRIAMWSGPRNISTAMMRSWGSRADTRVCDEPFYAHYLEHTGLAHPGREAVIAAHDSDWRRVARWLTGPVTDDRPLFYQKHMAHHFLPHMDGAWLESLTHGFLIRDPASMLVSLDRVYPDPVASDTGLPQQLKLYRRFCDQAPAPVVDSRDVLEDPEGMLRALCAALGVDWDPAMLRWEPGIRDTDGVWAPHWYDQVAESTGFKPYRERPVTVPDRLRGVLEECQPIYQTLYERRITPEQR